MSSRPMTCVGRTELLMLTSQHQHIRPLQPASAVRPFRSLSWPSPLSRSGHLSSRTSCPFAPMRPLRRLYRISTSTGSPMARWQRCKMTGVRSAPGFVEGTVAMEGKRWWNDMATPASVADRLSRGSWSAAGQPAFNDIFVSVARKVEPRGFQGRKLASRPAPCAVALPAGKRAAAEQW